MRDNLLEMPQDNPFQNDLFDRKTIAENFMKIFEADEEGIILSIDSAWGTGKTTFIKMWETMINNRDEYKNKYETFYFNAWENDYIQDPLLAILTEIEVNDDKKRQVFENIKNKGKKIVKPLLSTGLKVATHGIINIDSLQLDSYIKDEIPELIEKIGDSMFEETVELKKSRQIFKEFLEKEQQTSGKTIIFFIDELDRCRPTFAIELLEVIKHLFSTKGVIFVISLDKEQLSYSIQNIYGQNMNVDGYLRRFFDLDFKLPMPDKVQYFNNKYKKILLKNINQDTLKIFKQFLLGFIKWYNFSLRDIDKILDYIKYLISLIKEFQGSYGRTYTIVISYLYAYLISLKIKDSNLYRKIINLDYENNETDIKLTFGLENIKNISFQYDFSDIIKNKNIINKLNEEVLIKFLKAIKGIEDYNINLESEEFIISLNGNLESLSMEYLFSNKQCNLIKNLEFVENISFGE